MERTDSFRDESTSDPRGSCRWARFAETGKTLAEMEPNPAHENEISRTLNGLSLEQAVTSDRNRVGISDEPSDRRA